MNKDALGDRMKDHEQRARVFLPRRTHTLLRLDGRAFHTYTRGLDRPFDVRFGLDMVSTAQFLAQRVSGCVFAYVQSDEISLVLTDFAEPTSEPWFGNNLQKIVSVSAALATARFNQLRFSLRADPPVFDARAWTIADPMEVSNYFIWRQKDAQRNSVAMVAQSRYSQKQLQGVGVAQMREMLAADGDDWEIYPRMFRFGSVVVREERVTPAGTELEGIGVLTEDVVRRPWEAFPAPDFIVERSWMLQLLAGHTPVFPAG